MLERLQEIPVHVQWGSAERNIRVVSSQMETVVTRIESERERQENETGHRQTYGGDTPRKQEKTMWVGGYYVDKYRRCGCGNIWTARQMLQGFLNKKPKWLKTNFLHAEENVRVPDFHKDSCYYSSPRRPNGFDGVDSVHIAFICAHGGTSPGVANICMFDKNRACGNATSNNMSLGQNKLRYLFMSACDLLPIANPAGGWFPQPRVSGRSSGLPAPAGRAGRKGTFSGKTGRDLELMQLLTRGWMRHGVPTTKMYQWLYGSALTRIRFGKCVRRKLSFTSSLCNPTIPIGNITPPNRFAYARMLI